MQLRLKAPVLFCFFPNLLQGIINGLGCKSKFALFSIYDHPQLSGMTREEFTKTLNFG